MIKKNIFVVFLFQILPLFVLKAGSFGAMYAQTSLKATLQEASTAFDSKDYVLAIKIYESITHNNGKSAEIAYNLGNAYYQNNEIGRAILQYERGLKIAPFDSDIIHNLSVAAHTQTDNLVAIKPFFLIRWVKAIRNFFGSDTWAAFGLLFMAVFAGGLLIWLFGGTREQKRKGFILGLLALLFSILPFYASYDRSKLEEHSGFAIILAKETAFRSAPDSESEMILPLHEGLKIELLDAIGEWVKIELPNGEQGWILASAAEEI